MENLTKGLAELQLLAKERKDVPSGKTEFERRTATVPRGRRGSWNTPQRSNFRSQPMEGQRGRPGWRPRFYRPIEARRCYECGKPGHLSYNCPKLQVQGKFASVTKNNQTSHDEPRKGSLDESDPGEFSEREYEKDEYEVQAFMAR